MNFRPGIVAIRPLQLSDILDGAFKLIRFNPKATIGLALVVMLFIGLGTVLLSVLGNPVSYFFSRVFDRAVLDAGTINNLYMSVFPGIAAAVLPALLIYVTMQAVLARKANLGQVWQATKGRLLPYLGSQLLIGSAMIILIVVTGLFIWLTATQLGLAAIGLGLLLLIVLMLAIYAINIKLLFVGPAIVLEKQGVFNAFQRSWRLSSGQFWRILGIRLLTSLIIGLISSIITTPIVMAVAVADPASFFGPDLGFSYVLVNTAAQVIAGTLTTPFDAAVSCLLYVDQRIRKEGLDIELINEVGRQTP